MQIDQTRERLAAALNHRYDRAKLFAAERDKNRKHHTKYSASIRASMKRRMEKPKNKASASALGRITHLFRHVAFQDGKYPPSMGGAMTYEIMLGCDAVVFREYIGSLFHHGMNWGNYGSLWHLGHRVPVRLFDCSDPQQLRACFHYKNLQPELPEENMRRMNEERITPSPFEG